MNRITIHIGLHKTGTTFLQQSLLNNIPEVSVITGSHSHRHLIDVNLEKHLIISDEGISGRLWGNSYLEDFYSNIKKIKKIYGNPRIIFGIRNQESFIPSVYKQYLNEKGYKDFNMLFSVDNEGLRKHEDFLLIPKINYLKNNFADVFIYSQESLLSRQNDFLLALSNFLELNQKISIPKEILNKKLNIGVKTELQVKTLRKLNKLNSRLEHINPKLSLYSKIFRKLNITPRNICQTNLKRLESNKFEIPQDSKIFIRQYYKNDWDAASNIITY